MSRTAMPARGHDATGGSENTDRELYRERPGDYYADSIHVTKDVGIGINCGGSVIVMPLRKWFMLAAQVTTTAPRSETSAPSGMVLVSRSFLEATPCPNCGGQGWYVVPNRNTGDPEQEQCQWCDEKSTALKNAAPQELGQATTGTAVDSSAVSTPAAAASAPSAEQVKPEKIDMDAARRRAWYDKARVWLGEYDQEVRKPLLVNVVVDELATLYRSYIHCYESSYFGTPSATRPPAPSEKDGWVVTGAQCKHTGQRTHRPCSPTCDCVRYMMHKDNIE